MQGTLPSLVNFILTNSMDIIVYLPPYTGNLWKGAVNEEDYNPFLPRTLVPSVSSGRRRLCRAIRVQGVSPRQGPDHRPGTEAPTGCRRPEPGRHCGGRQGGGPPGGP